MTQKKISFFSKGRSHILDLCKALLELNQNINLYSDLPNYRVRQFNWPVNRHYSLLPYVLPLVPFVQKPIFPHKLQLNISDLYFSILDNAVRMHLKPCDVFVGLSGLTLNSAKFARKSWGARIIIERGSRHILSQKEILDAIPNHPLPSVTNWIIDRELEAYEFADKIVVPSRHVEESFLERGIAANKLFRNPYGVDLSMFPPTDAPKTNTLTLIMVGAWSLRKGCDILVQACRKLKNIKLLHVGLIGDAPLPTESWFHDFGPVNQSRLTQFYAKAHALILPSREEGLSLVQAQALASGCHVICSNRTGGEDLKEFLTDPSLIRVTPSNDADSLAALIESIRERCLSQKGLRNTLHQERNQLSWLEASRRYLSILE